MTQIFRPQESAPTRTTPFVGARVCCGAFSPATDDYVERELDLNELCISNPAETYFIRATGDSMIPWIQPDDYLIVDRAQSPRDYDRIVCILDGEFAARRFRCEGDVVVLESDNLRVSAIRVDSGRDFEVWGVITGIIRLHRA